MGGLFERGNRYVDTVLATARFIESLFNKLRDPGWSH